LLGSKDNFSKDELGDMQLDLISSLSLRWKDLFAAGAEKLGKTKLSRTIAAWDGSMAEDNEIALLFSYWWYYLAHALFEDNLGSDWPAGHLIKEEVLSENILEIIDDRRTERIETREDISEIAVGLALTKAANRKLGEVNILNIRHPLARVKILDTWLNLNRGPFAIGGNPGSLNAQWGFYNEKDDRFYAAVGPSMRYLLDWSDVDGFTINVAMGQSGNPFSKHYDDFLELHRKGDRWTVPFTKEKVFANKTSLLTLNPKK
jgi:penicillin amidase